ncbi:MAG: NAD(P)/FAD-dependent oxidoreductase [Gemmiger sp.]|uniref:NAD(P)/FAD-dependent oxidoreductase n=1 Tax=Gemmiger sp. TaxID=2049027 RepID=UPI002E7A5852|nr:NAD(P)/FAD-dependent oxidoreductase [Gemmiger sp.]MEE0800623.1 NAD(P)/FAD-dependent oxidoreductase [Gemmiger sp.]
MKDLLIVGSGPAGISAALTAAARGLDFLWFGSRALSPKIAQAPEIANYPGLCRVRGCDFQKILQDQVGAMGLTIREERIDSIYAMGDSFTACVNETMYEARAVLLAVGVSTAGAVPGELEYVGQGVSYCATCDGALYRGKTIAVVSTNPAFEEEVTFLVQLAGRAYVSRSYPAPDAAGEPTGFPKSIRREDGRLQITYADGDRTVDGIFFLKDSVSPAVLMPGLAMDGAHIAVNRELETNIPGCFAAGDCTGRPYQYAKAVGEGNVAVHTALRWLKEKQQA